MKYRIKEIGDGDRYIPQYRSFLFFWETFYTSSYYPEKVSFLTFKEAKEFIQRQIELSKPVIERDTFWYSDDYKVWCRN